VGQKKREPQRKLSMATSFLASQRFWVFFFKGENGNLQRDPGAAIRLFLRKTKGIPEDLSG
jgi:hypothetical protein